MTIWTFHWWRKGCSQLYSVLPYLSVWLISEYFLLEHYIYMIFFAVPCTVYVLQSGRKVSRLFYELNSQQNVIHSWNWKNTSNNKVSQWYTDKGTHTDWCTVSPLTGNRTHSKTQDSKEHNTINLWNTAHLLHDHKPNHPPTPPHLHTRTHIHYQVTCACQGTDTHTNRHKHTHTHRKQLISKEFWIYNQKLKIRYKQAIEGICIYTPTLQHLANRKQI